MGGAPREKVMLFLGLGIATTGKPQREEHPRIFQGLWVSLVLHPLSVGFPIGFLCFSAGFSLGSESPFLWVIRGSRVFVSLGSESSFLWAVSLDKLHCRLEGE